MQGNTLLFLYLLFAAFIGLFSVIINALFLRFSGNLGTRNTDPSAVRWSSTTKPALGGISFYIIFLLSIAFYSVFLHNEVNFINTQMMGILGAVSLGFLLGLADDAYNTKPLMKLALQILCGLILVSTGTYIKILPNDFANYALTMFWVVGLMNSVNMLDNMDGVTTTTSISIVTGAIALLLIQGNVTGIHLAMLVGVLAALCGFLVFNWHPSRMYMGDTGSMFLGVFLAAIGIIYFWNSADYKGQVVQSKQFIIAALMFIVPICDTATVTINRLLKGKSPFVGGKDHTTHHLSYFGFSDRGVALTLFGISFATNVLCVTVVNFIDDWSLLHFIGFAVYFLIIFAFLYGNTRIDWKSKR
jgi:UDP-GlcNAc:undecaprenyl-phosphate GlcNAc-1-phosphate transferase